MEDGIELGLEGLDHAVQYADKLPSVITSPKLPHFGRRRSQDKSRSKSKDYNNHNEDYNDDDRYQEPPPSANSSRRRSLSSQYYDSRRGDDNYVHQPSISSPRSGGDGLRREEAITFPRSRRDTLSPRDSRYGTRPRSSSAYYDDEPYYSSSDDEEIERHRPTSSKTSDRKSKGMDKLKKVFSADDMDTETKAIGAAAVGLVGLWGYTTLMDRQKSKKAEAEKEKARKEDRRRRKSGEGEGSYSHSHSSRR